MRALAMIRRTNAAAATPTMVSSFVRKVNRMGCASPYGDHLRSVQIGARGDVRHCAVVLEHIFDGVLVLLELRRRNVAPGEDALLPVTFHRLHGALQDVLREF